MYLFIYSRVNMLKLSKLIIRLVICSLSFLTTTSYAEEEIYVNISDDVELTVKRYDASGKHLIIWLTPEYGFRKGHFSMANLMALQGIEVWQTNVVESLFLPLNTNALKELDGSHIAKLIEYAHKQTGKKVVLVGDSYASVHVLTSAHKWQQNNYPSNSLIGAILFTPFTYSYIPTLGLKPEYMPIVDSTNIPLMIYQAKNSGNINQFQTVLAKLQQHNNPVYSKFVPDLMSLFYEATQTETMKHHAKTLLPNIKKMIAVLEKHTLPTKPIPIVRTRPNISGIDIQLKEFKGGFKPLNINLQDTNNKSYVRTDYRDKITIVNFWATWCPPCVEEIPSLNRLVKKMEGKNFELISINYAEDKKTIDEFMKQVEVDYPVLLDKDGKFAKQWNVISYPSTFIIDSKGEIRYGVNSAILWDSPELINVLTPLLPKK